MASLNITSLLKHIDELRIVLDGQPIDILVIAVNTQCPCLENKSHNGLLLENQCG